MRLDHIAYRVPDRDKTVDLLDMMFGYKVDTQFTIGFDNGSTAKCKALVPRLGKEMPEIFVSEGSPGSIIEQWIQNTPKGHGGIHHLAYSVNDIDEWFSVLKQKGIEFSSEEIIDCPEDNLRQIFTKPQPLLGGVIIELIQRGDKGFCQNSVKTLMESTNEASDQ